MSHTVLCPNRLLVWPERYAVSDCERADWFHASQWRSNGFVPRFCLHRLDASNFSLGLQSLQGLWVTYQGHVSSLSAWVLPYPPGYVFPFLFVAGGIRFLTPPTPAEEFGSPCGFAYPLRGLQRGFHVPLL